jgi:hypothetical protein
VWDMRIYWSWLPSNSYFAIFIILFLNLAVLYTAFGLKCRGTPCLVVGFWHTLLWATSMFWQVKWILKTNKFCIIFIIIMFDNGVCTQYLCVLNLVRSRTQMGRTFALHIFKLEEHRVVNVHSKWGF